jgi:hypothetical protein
MYSWHLGLDPVDRERDQPHATLRVESLDGLHQADVAFLDQVRRAEAVPEITPATETTSLRCESTSCRAAFESSVSRKRRARLTSSSALSTGKRFTDWI